MRLLGRASPWIWVETTKLAPAAARVAALGVGLAILGEDGGDSLGFVLVSGRRRRFVGTSCYQASPASVGVRQPSSV